MKVKNWLVFTTVAITILLLSALTVMAVVGNETIMSQIVGVTDLKDTHKVTLTENKEPYTQITNRALEFLNANDIVTNARNMGNEEFNVEFVKDNITNEEYYKVQGNTALLYITEDGTVTTYLNTSPTTLYSDYISDTKALNSVKNFNLEEKAKELFSKTDLVENATNYSLTKVVEKDTYFPTAWFESQLDKRIIFFAFNPETLEILNMGNQKMILSQNNEVKISEETAKKIATEMLSKSSQDIRDIKLDDVVPNEFFKQSNEDVFYTMLDYKRKAYIITFNDIYSIQVYVDATTGEVIGGNGVW